MSERLTNLGELKLLADDNYWRVFGELEGLAKAYGVAVDQILDFMRDKDLEEPDDGGFEARLDDLVKEQHIDLIVFDYLARELSVEKNTREASRKNILGATCKLMSSRGNRWSEEIMVSGERIVALMMKICPNESESKILELLKEIETKYQSIVKTDPRIGRALDLDHVEELFGEERDADVAEEVEALSTEALISLVRKVVAK